LDELDLECLETKDPVWSISNSSEERFLALRVECVKALGGDIDVLASGIEGRSGAREIFGVSSDGYRLGTVKASLGFRGYKISSPPLSSAIDGRVRRVRC